MGSLAVMAHYDPDGLVAPHTRRQIEALTAVCERVIVVSTADLRPEDAAWLRANAELMQRENHGYDFYSYRTGLLAAGDLARYDRVVICNDSFVGPFVDYQVIFSHMAEAPYDFWGLTWSLLFAPHAQSFFVCFMPWVVRSRTFRQFWERMVPVSDRRHVIHRYEIGLSRVLHAAGFVGGAYFEPSDRDRRMARARMVWWASLKAQGESAGQRRKTFSSLARTEWNVCVTLADRALTTPTLPFVKIETLRFDPGGLDSQRLLRACQASLPEHFHDFAAYLDRTARHYPPRKLDELPAPSAALRPLLPLVRYV